MAAEVTFNLAPPLNESFQIGDVAYYANTTTASGITLNSGLPVKIGTVIKIEKQDISLDGNIDNILVTCLAISDEVVVDPGMFIMFAKNRAANETSMQGYYGSFEFKNNSLQPAELFQTGCEVTTSS